MTRACACSPIIAFSDESAGSTNEDVFEELSCTTSSSPVDVPLQAFFEHEARFFKDPRVEIAAVIDDDHNGRSRLREPCGVSKRSRDPLDITIKCASAYAPIGRADFQVALIWKIQ